MMLILERLADVIVLYYGMLDYAMLDMISSRRFLLTSWWMEFLTWKILDMLVFVNTVDMVIRQIAYHSRTLLQKVALWVSSPGYFGPL